MNYKEYINSLINEIGKGSAYKTDQLRNRISDDREMMREQGIDYFDAVEYLANHWGMFV